MKLPRAEWLAALILPAFVAIRVAAQEPSTPPNRAGASQRLGPLSDRWEPEISALERRVSREAVGTGGVVFYGSSSFRMWTNVVEAFPGHRVVNLGFGGSQLSDLNRYFDRLVPPLQPRLLLIYGGDNDLAAGKTPAQVESDFRELVGRVRGRLPQTRVAFVSVKPSPSRLKWLEAQQLANDRVRRMAARWRRVDYLDAATPLMGASGQPEGRFFGPDRLHMNGEGYAVWRKVLEPYVERWDR
jgi:lysophospholipase L1-like esterase